MKKNRLLFIFLVIISLFACRTEKQRDTSLMMNSYSPNPWTDISIDSADKNDSGNVFLREAKLLQLPMERAATMIADCLLTLDFIDSGINPNVNRDSFASLFTSLSAVLREYRDKDLNAHIDAINELLKEKPLSPGKIRKIFEDDILNGFFKKYTAAIKCANCYTYDDLLGHIAFWYQLLSHDYFGADIHEKKMICCRPITTLRREFAQKIARELMNKFDYIKNYKTLREYQFKYNIYRILDRGKNSTAVLSRDSLKIRVVQPFIPGKVDMVYELSKNASPAPDELNNPEAGLAVRFNWKE